MKNVFLLFLVLCLLKFNAFAMVSSDCSGKRVIVICAHPDDAELTSGGTSILLSNMGYDIKFISLTNGNKGHFMGTKGEIAARRCREVEEVKNRMKCEYEVLNIEDGELDSSLQNRLEVIRLIREWKADIVITHPPYDYHPDHRNTSLLVQDAAFLVNVPKLMPEVPVLERSPLFLYTRGRYVNPIKPQPDIVVDITAVVEDKAYIIDAHESQIYEWLPWINKIEKPIPKTQKERLEYVKNEYVLKRGVINKDDKAIIEKWYGKNSLNVKVIEAFEICEFGRTVNEEDIRKLFPMFRFD